MTINAFELAQAWLPVRLPAIVDRLRQRSTYGPALSSEPLLNHMRADTYSSAPSCERIRLSIVGDWRSASMVGGLNRLRGPAAIFRRVWAVVVLAFQGFSLWAFSHVSQEGFERVLPPLAYCDSPTSIPLVIRGLRLEATTPHRSPRSVLRADGSPVRLCWGWPLFAIATARYEVSPAKCCDTSKTLSSAIAEAEPVAASPVVPNGNETIESLPCQIGHRPEFHSQVLCHGFTS